MTDVVKEKANEILINLLDKAIQGIDAAVTFSQAQIPDVIHQLLIYKTWKYGFAVSFCFILMLLTVWIFIKVWKVADGSEQYFFGLVISGLVFASILIIFCNKISYLTMILVAPKLYLIEYTSSLLKG